MNKQILVVDDDITSLDIVAFVFEKRGFNVERAADGPAAVQFLKTNQIDLAIFDLLMPGMNGVEAVELIRKSNLTQAPIIAFTAVDDPDLHESAVKAGCNSVLTKPCSTDRLVKEIKKYLELN
jgi:two-component system response regulator ResD